ncbi:MAG: YtxH domain-containing protein [Candidatus Margulisiibacteriota bacterium]
MGNRKSKFTLGLFLGSIIGAITALLYAPQSGEKTREWVQKTTEENQDKIDEFKKVANTTKNKVVETAKEAKDAIEDSLCKLTETIKEKDQEGEKPND